MFRGGPASWREGGGKVGTGGFLWVFVVGF